MWKWQNLQGAQGFFYIKQFEKHSCGDLMMKKTKVFKVFQLHLDDLFPTAQLSPNEVLCKIRVRKIRLACRFFSPNFSMLRTDFDLPTVFFGKSQWKFSIELDLHRFANNHRIIQWFHVAILRCLQLRRFFEAWKQRPNPPLAKKGLHRFPWVDAKYRTFFGFKRGNPTCSLSIFERLLALFFL